MRKPYYSRNIKHIGKFSSVIITTLLSCASSMADDSTSKTQVAIPSPDTTAFVYNGGLQTYALAEDSSYTIYGNTHTFAGQYEVTVALNNTTLFEWEDGSVDKKKFSFVIKKMQVETPDADTTKFTYNGKQQDYTIADREYYSVEGFRKSTAGNSVVVVSLNDTVNYEWADATIADKEYNFLINKAVVEIPAADTNQFTYNGSTLVYTIKPNIHYSVAGNIQTAAGSHKVEVALENETNYAWSDGTSEAKSYEFLISKASIKIPTASQDTFAFDGRPKIFHIAESSNYTVDISNEIGSSVGTYDRTVSLNDPDNYIWEDNTSEPKTITFVIKEGVVKIPESKAFDYTGSEITLVAPNEAYTVGNGIATDAGVYNVDLVLEEGYIWENGTKGPIYIPMIINPIIVEKPNVSSTVVTYDGKTYSINIPSNTAYTVSGISTAVEPGTYTTTATLKSNYAWSDTTTEVQTYILKIEKIKVAIPSTDSSIFYYSRKMQTYFIEENINYTVEGNNQSEIGSHDIKVELKDTIHYEWTDATVEAKHYQFDIVENNDFGFELTEFDTNVAAGTDFTINLNVDGMVQYYKISCSQLPELRDSLIEFNNESSSIKIPTSSNIAPGNYKMNVTLISGNIDTTFTVNMTVNYPASAIIVCWNDVVAVDNSIVKATKYQWYKDGEVIPGATGQYYTDKNGLCGYYKCEVDGGLIVGPTYLDFGRPVQLTAYGAKGKIYASVVGSTTANVLLMSVGGMTTDSKPAAKEMVFTVNPGIYVLTLDGTDQSVKVIVK